MLNNNNNKYYHFNKYSSDSQIKYRLFGIKYKIIMMI